MLVKVGHLCHCHLAADKWVMEFRMRLTMLAVLMSAAWLVFGGGLAHATTFTKPKYYKSCQMIYSKLYVKGRSHKAFAVNNPPGANKISAATICWSTDNMPTRKSAISHSLAKCAGEVIRRHGSGKCRIFAAE